MQVGSPARSPRRSRGSACSNAGTSLPPARTAAFLLSPSRGYKQMLLQTKIRSGKIDRKPKYGTNQKRVPSPELLGRKSPQGTASY